MTTDGSQHHSAIFAGEVLHHRFRPRRHRFRYPVYSFLFDLDELDQLDTSLRLLSVNRFNLFSFYHRDLGEGKDEPPRDYLVRTLDKHGIHTPLQRAELLCYPRILGYTFNPLSVYYCYDREDGLFAVVYEVSNTFGERHSYLIDVAEDQRHSNVVRQSCNKDFYVSPFIPMAMRYHFRLRRPEQRLAVAIRETDGDGGLLHAVFRGQRRSLTDGQLLRCFARLPFMTLRIVAAIHWQALKLFLKGIKLVPKNHEPDGAISRIRH